MKNVLLINPPLFFSEGIPKSIDVSVPSLGMLYLASYIKKYSDDFNIEIMDVSAENLDLKQIKKKIMKLKPFVIGISAMTAQLQGAVELAKLIKKLKLESKVFLGGPHISADPGFIKRNPRLFDYAITGEAEKTFLKSIQRISKKKKIPILQKGEIIKKLDEIPFPDKELIKREFYIKTESLLFSRGCPFNCYYCSRPSISEYVRYYSVTNLINHIKSVYDYYNGNIFFQDDNFTINNKKVLEFCKKVQKQRLKLNWHCNARIDLVNDKLLKNMALAGCEQINFGIESGNEKLRKVMIRKNFSNKKIKSVFKSCKKHGIKVGCYFIIGHPTETKKNLQETKKMILDYDIDIVGLALPSPFPGSKLYEIAKKEGIIDEELIDDFAHKRLGEGYSGVYPVYHPKEIPMEYLLEEMKDINRKFYLNFKTIIRALKEHLLSFSMLKRDVKDFFYLIFHGTSSRKPYIKKKGAK